MYLFSGRVDRENKGKWVRFLRKEEGGKLEEEVSYSHETREKSGVFVAILL